MRSHGIHLGVLWLEDLKKPINKTRLKIAVLKWHPGLPGANELTLCMLNTFDEWLTMCMHLFLVTQYWFDAGHWHSLSRKTRAYVDYSQYRGCWWPGDMRSQGIGIHGYDLIMSMEYFVASEWLRLIYYSLKKASIPNIANLLSIGPYGTNIHQIWKHNWGKWAWKCCLWNC